MRDDDLKILSEQNNETLARWHCILNSWLWPDKLPDPQVGVDTAKEQQDRRHELMGWIEQKIGRESIRVYWNGEWRKEARQRRREQGDVPYERRSGTDFGNAPPVQQPQTATESEQHGKETEQTDCNRPA